MRTHVRSVQVGELISISVAGSHKVGKQATFDLVRGNVAGEEVDSVRAVRGPTPDGQLLLEMKSGQRSRFKLQLDITPSTNAYSVLMYNVGPVHKVEVPGLKCPLNLSGPALIFTGSDVFCYDGQRGITVHHGYILDSYPLLVFVVGRHVMLQNQFKRKSIKLPSAASDKETLLVTYINLATDETNEVIYTSDVTKTSEVVLSSNL